MTTQRKIRPHERVSDFLDAINYRLTGQRRGSTTLSRNYDHQRFGVKLAKYRWKQYDDAGSNKKTEYESAWLHIHLGRWTYTRPPGLGKSATTPKKL